MDFSAQSLINSGSAWTLEGSIGRACMDAIRSGYAILGPSGIKDYYGNYVPSRYEVEDGTKGSLSYANNLRDTDFTEADFDEGRAGLDDGFEDDDDLGWG